METMQRDVRRKRAAHLLFKDMSCIDLCFSIEMFSVMEFGIWLIFMVNKYLYIPHLPGTILGNNNDLRVFLTIPGRFKVMCLYEENNMIRQVSCVF